jgi:hypothetical protein
MRTTVTRKSKSARTISVPSGGRPIIQKYSQSQIEAFANECLKAASYEIMSLDNTIGPLFAVIYWLPSKICEGVDSMVGRIHEVEELRNLTGRGTFLMPDMIGLEVNEGGKTR